MNHKNSTLKEKLIELTNKKSKTISFMAIVRKVDENGKTCVVEPILHPEFDEKLANDSYLIYNVFITPASTTQFNNSYALVPTISSYVMVSWAENEDKFISMFSHISSLQLAISKTLEVEESPVQGNFLISSDGFGYSSGNTTFFVNENILLQNNSSKIKIEKDKILFPLL